MGVPQTSVIRTAIEKEGNVVIPNHGIEEAPDQSSQQVVNVVFDTSGS